MGPTWFMWQSYNNHFDYLCLAWMQQLSVTNQPIIRVSDELACTLLPSRKVSFTDKPEGLMSLNHDLQDDLCFHFGNPTSSTTLQYVWASSVPYCKLLIRTQHFLIDKIAPPANRSEESHWWQQQRTSSLFYHLLLCFRLGRHKLFVVLLVDCNYQAEVQSNTFSCMQSGWL